jgi:hypothetical protein
MWLNFDLRTLILTVSSVQQVSSWGKQGHFISAMIARAFLNQRGELLVGSLLGPDAIKLGEPFYEAAVWADWVQNDPSYKWSRELHYMHSPSKSCEWFKFEIDSIGTNGDGPGILGGISKFSGIVADSTVDTRKRAESLKFLIHLLSDVNQPLHVGRCEDRGGSRIVVKPPWEHAFDKGGNPISSPRPRSLHVLWDSHILDYTLSTSGIDWVEQGERLIEDIHKGAYTPPSRDIVLNSVMRAQFSSRLANRAAYKDRGQPIGDSDELSLDYYKESSKIVLNQLVNSGLDIAHALNVLGEQVESHPSDEADANADSPVRRKRKLIINNPPEINAGTTSF